MPTNNQCEHNYVHRNVLIYEISDSYVFVVMPLLQAKALSNCCQTSIIKSDQATKCWPTHPTYIHMCMDMHMYMYVCIEIHIQTHIHIFVALVLFAIKARSYVCMSQCRRACVLFSWRLYWLEVGEWCKFIELSYWDIFCAIFRLRRLSQPHRAWLSNSGL